MTVVVVFASLWLSAPRLPPPDPVDWKLHELHDPFPAAERARLPPEEQLKIHELKPFQDSKATSR
jgi:hypothetical protein